MMDPSFNPDLLFGIDPCCGQTFDVFFYNWEQVSIPNGNGGFTPKFDELMAVYDPNTVPPNPNYFNAFGPNVDPIPFSSWQELADIVTGIMQDNPVQNFPFADYEYRYFEQSSPPAWGFVEVVDNNLPGVSISLRNSTTGDLYKGHAVPYNDVCPVNNPDIDISDLTGNNPPEDITLFNGTGGIMTTSDIAVDLEDAGSGQVLVTGDQIGHMVNAAFGSGAVDIGAGCFNINCAPIDLMADCFSDSPTINDHLANEGGLSASEIDQFWTELEDSWKTWMSSIS